MKRQLFRNNLQKAEGEDHRTKELTYRADLCFPKIMKVYILLINLVKFVGKNHHKLTEEHDSLIACG